MDYRNFIENYIQECVKNCLWSELYREAIVGFSSAEDPLYQQLYDATNRKMLEPKDLLPTAKTVVSFFIPFSEEIAKKVASGGKINQTWSDMYSLTNPLLSEILDGLQRELKEKGIDSAGEPPTMNYDPVQLTAKWSHKSSAVIAGIATFGLHRLLITKSGTIGRMSSLVIDCELEPTQRPDTEYCLYKKNGSCGICMERCPSGALKPDGFDRFRCNAYLDGKNISDYEQGCGMCSTGPCALKGFE
ncbi:MAG: epoxyqueuosine reductase [Eubacteriales bacterium]